jgi:hypothetical protein
VATGVTSTGGDRDAHTRRKDVAVLLAALEFVDQHEAARVAQALDRSHRVHALEGRQHHAVLEGKLVLLLDLAGFVQLGDEHLAVFHPRGPGVGDPLDVVVAQFALQHALGVAHAAQAQMPDVGLSRDEGDGHLVTQPALLQVAAEDERELVGRAEARGTRHRADDRRAAFLHELLVALPCTLGMVDGADRLREALRPGARHLLESQLRAGGDDEVVVGEGAAVLQLQRVGVGRDARDGLSDEVDALALQRGPDREGDRLALAPAHRQPRVGGHELEVVHRVDDGDAVAVAELGLQLVGCGHAAGAGAEYDDMCHGGLLVR